MLDLLVYLTYKLFRIIVLSFPKSIIKIILDGLTSFVNIVNVEHKRYAKANLDLVYGDHIPEEKKYDIIKNSYRNLIYNMYEFCENPTLKLEQLDDKITVENEDKILDALSSGRKLILITAHYGNWEYMTSYISLKYKATTVVGRPMNNKYLNDDLVKTRNAHNSHMLNKNRSASGLLKALKKDRMIGIVIDQHVQKKYGEDILFLDHKATMTNSASRIALKTDAIIIPVYFIMDDFRKYTIKFDNIIDPSVVQSDDAVVELTQLQANSISEQILSKPDDWFWQHKRFKLYNGDIYEK